MGDTFADFWSAYPRRKGSKAIAEAEKRFNLAIKKGADPKHIVSSARRFYDEAKEQGNIDTPFIPLASTWLNQRRWLDYAIVDEVAEAAKPPQFFVSRFSPEWDLWQTYLRSHGSPTGSPVSPRDNGWWFPSPTPPDAQQKTPA